MQFRHGSSNRVPLQGQGVGCLPQSIWWVITTTVVPRRAARPRVTLRIPPHRHRPLPIFPPPFLSAELLSLCGFYYYSRRFDHPATAPVCGLGHRTCGGAAACAAAPPLLSRPARTGCRRLCLLRLVSLAELPPSPCHLSPPLLRMQRPSPRALPVTERRLQSRSNRCSPARLAPSDGGRTLLVFNPPPLPCPLFPPLQRVRQQPRRAPSAASWRPLPRRHHCSPARPVPGVGGSALFVLELPPSPCPPWRPLPRVGRQRVQASHPAVRRPLPCCHGHSPARPALRAGGGAWCVVTVLPRLCPLSQPLPPRGASNLPVFCLHRFVLVALAFYNGGVLDDGACCHCCGSVRKRWPPSVRALPRRCLLHDHGRCGL